METISIYIVLFPHRFAIMETYGDISLQITCVPWSKLDDMDFGA